MPATGAMRSRKLQRLLNARWWDFNKGQTLRLVTGNVPGEPWEVEPGPDIAGMINADTTFSIPSDYSTLQAAIDDLADRIIVRGVTVTLNIESGHALTAPLSVTDGDYSMFRITSDDATVPLDAGFPAEHVLQANRAKLPQLHCLIDAGGLGLDGVRLDRHAWIYVEPGGGVINAANSGLDVRERSFAYARNTDWSGAGSGGPNDNCVDVSNSVADVRDATCDNANGGHGVRGSANSVVECRGVSATGCTRAGGRASHGTTMSALAFNADGAGDYGLRCDGGSSMYAAGGAVATNAGTYGILCEGASQIMFRDGDADGADRGIYCDGASRVEAQNATARNCTTMGVSASNGGSVDFAGGDASGGGSFGVRAIRGAHLNLDGATTRMGGSDAANDTTVALGSTINASAVTGGLSQTANSVTADGIIFQ